MAERTGEDYNKKNEEEGNHQKKRVAIGIDLGTTFSCVAYVKPKPEDMGEKNKTSSKSTAPHVEVIANDQGSRTTPSYVAFTDEERHIGQPAKEQIAENPKNTVYSAKRMIGRRWNDPILQKDILTFPFKVTSSLGGGGNSDGEEENLSDYDHCDSSSEDEDDEGSVSRRQHRRKGQRNGGDEERPVIEVTYKTETKKFSCEEISSMVLSKMKETAEAFIGETVTDAVITVPAYFNDSQRQATKTAGDIVGINVLSILNEPTAAAIAYGMNNYTGGDDDDGEAGGSSAAAEAKNVMIFDLGGGTFDVVILCIDGGIFDVRAIGGDNHLGGEDFDLLMVDHFVKEYKRKNSQDITGDPRAMQRLKKGCEKAKRTLSSSTKANINLDCLYGGLDFRTTITRVRFNELCSDLFDKTITLVEKTLSEAQLNKSDLDDIVLVGGSSRIPKVQELLTDFFDGKQLSQNIHPDEAVAYGAAIQASILGGDCHSHHRNIKLLDVAPMSLGVETIGGQMRTIIKKNTRVPTKQTTRDFTTYLDNQENLKIQVFEGEHKLTEDNNPLGSFILSEIQSAPRGVPSIDITFELDSNGILKVSAEDRATKSAKRISIDSNKGQLGKKSIQRMIASGKTLRDDDKKIHEVNQMRGRLESYCFRSKASAQSNEAKQRLTRLEINQVTGFCDEVLEWLEDNQRLSMPELKERMEKLVGDCEGSLSKLKVGMT